MGVGQAAKKFGDWRSQRQRANDPVVGPMDRWQQQQN